MNVIKSISTYTLAGFFTTGISFIIMPVLTHYLNPSDYGLLSIFNIYVSLLVPFTSLLSTGIIYIEYFNKGLSKNNFIDLFSTITIFPIFIFFGILILFHFLTPQISEALAIPKNFVLLIPILALLTVYRDQLLNFWITEKKAALYSIGNISKTVVEIGLTLTLIIGLSYDWEGRIYSWLITAILFSTVAFFYFSSKGLLRLNFSKTHILYGLSYGLPLIIHTLSKTIVNQSDRIFISKMVSVEETGIYTTGYLVGSVILILCTAFSNFYSPYIYEKLSGEFSEVQKLKTVKLTYTFLLFVLFALFVLALTSDLLFAYFIDKSYAGGTAYVFWVGAGYFFWGVYLVFSTFIFYFKKTGIMAYLAIVNIVINIILNYCLIKYFGTIGAAYATTISFFIISVMMIYISTKMYKLPWLQFREIIDA